MMASSIEDETFRAYRDFVHFRQQRNPCIGRLCSFLATPRLPQDSCTIYVADLNPEPSVDVPTQRLKTVHSGELLSVLTPAPGRPRVIIIEDLHPSVLQMLGSSLDIDPIFFADYVLTDFENLETAPAPPSVALTPSQIRSQGGWLHIHYQQVIDLGPESAARFPWVLRTLANVPRSVRRLPLLQGRQLGIARACCSILTKHLNQSWLGIVLVDSTTPELISDPKLGGPPLRLRRSPLHEGFEDFGSPLSFSSFRSLQPGLNTHRNSLVNQLLSYYSSDSSLTQLTASANPLSLAYYPLRVIVGEWMMYSQVVARYLKHYEYSLNDRRLRLCEDDLIDLQKWRHRVVQTKVKLDATRDFISYHSIAESDRSSWDLLLKDLSHVSSKIERYGKSLERIIPVATSVFQLGEYRRSAIEAVYVRRLTYIALIFVLLSWVAALFSMGNEFAPGQRLFWVYFAVSVPSCLAFFVGAVVLSKS